MRLLGATSSEDLSRRAGGVAASKGANGTGVAASKRCQTFIFAGMTFSKMERRRLAFIFCVPMAKLAEADTTPSFVNGISAARAAAQNFCE